MGFSDNNTATLSGYDDNNGYHNRNGFFCYVYPYNLTIRFKRNFHFRDFVRRNTPQPLSHAKGGAFSINSHATFYFENDAAVYDSKFTFKSNFADEGGGAIYANDFSKVYFKNSEAYFGYNSGDPEHGHLNEMDYGGAILLEGTSALHIENSNITFEYNMSEFAGGAISAKNNSIIDIKNSNLTFKSNYGADGGHIALFNNSKMEITDSTVSFNNASDYGRTISGIYLEWGQINVYALNSDVSLSFKNSRIHFSATPFSSVITLNANPGRTISFPQGLETSGDDDTLIKRGRGSVFFYGEDARGFPTRIGKVDVKEGTIGFRDRRYSYVRQLQMSSATTLDLRGYQATTVRIADNNDVVLSSVQFAFDWGADFIEFAGGINVERSSVVVNFPSDPTNLGVSFSPISAASITYDIVYLVFNDNIDYTNYVLARYPTKLSIVFSPWSYFVDKYKTAFTQQTATLLKDIFAHDNAPALGTQREGANEITVDGRNHIVNSREFPNLGFIIKDSSMTFRNIAFASFTRNGASENGNGGAISISNSTVIFSGSSVNFITNAAVDSGGAIFVEKSTLNFANLKLNFKNNAAHSGGAIYTNDANIDFAGSSVDFTNNAANYGGALYADANSNVNFSASSINFIGNRATSGYGGGAIFIHDAQRLTIVKFIDSTVNFIANTAAYKGAAISVDKSTLSFAHSALNFKDNTAATSGGAMSVSDAIIDFADSSANFIGNTASIDGGAIHSDNSNINFKKSIVNFIGNKSLGYYGGAVYIHAASGNSGVRFINSMANFIGNTITPYSSGGGGAVYIERALFELIDSTALFMRNEGLSALRAERSDISFVRSSVSFIENTDADIFVINGKLLIDASEVSAMDGILISASSIAAISNSRLKFSGLNEFRHISWFMNGSNFALEDAKALFTDAAWALRAEASHISFIRSSATFIGNMGGAISAQNSTISFTNNTKAFFIGNRGETAIYAENSQINISADIEFSANEDGDIGLKDSKVLFMPDIRKRIQFKGGISDKGGVNEIIKDGAGEVVFLNPIHTPNVNFNIARGIAYFNASSNTFNELKVSSIGLLGISIDFRNPEAFVTALYIDSFNISPGATLLVKTYGFAALGTSVPFVYANHEFSFENMHEINFVGGYNYSLHVDQTRKIGILELKRLPPPMPTALFNISPIFIANAIRASAISDNSPIYSNIKDKVWLSAQASGGNLADEDNGNFGSSAAGAKTGYRVFGREGKTAGIFAGFSSRSYKQATNKATASDIDFGAYASFALDKKASLAGFLGYGLQNVKAEGGGSKAEFDAKVIKFGAKAEYEAGLISPFLSFEGAIVNNDDVNLGGADLEAAAYTRLSSQIGAKIGRQAGKLAWFGRAYIDLLLAGGRPEYNVKPDVDGAISQTIDGTAENAASFGLGAGGALPVNNAVDIFANADIKLGDDYFGYQANIGASFKF
jgi:predicted outer membrane repeat protein